MLLSPTILVVMIVLRTSWAAGPWLDLLAAERPGEALVLRVGLELVRRERSSAAPYHLALPPTL